MKHSIACCRIMLFMAAFGLCMPAFANAQCSVGTPPYSDDGPLCTLCTGTYLGIFVTPRYGQIQNKITTPLLPADELPGGGYVTTDCNTKSTIHEETQYVEPASHQAEHIYSHEKSSSTSIGFGFEVGFEGIFGLNFSHELLQSNNWQYTIRQSVIPGATSASVELKVPPGNIGIVQWASKSEKWDFERQEIKLYEDAYALPPNSPPMHIADCYYHVTGWVRFHGERHYNYTCKSGYPQYQNCAP